MASHKHTLGGARIHPRASLQTWLLTAVLCCWRGRVPTSLRLVLLPHPTNVLLPIKVLRIELVGNALNRGIGEVREGHSGSWSPGCPWAGHRRRPGGRSGPPHPQERRLVPSTHLRSQIPSTRIYEGLRGWVEELLEGRTISEYFILLYICHVVLNPIPKSKSIRKNLWSCLYFALLGVFLVQ